MKSVGNYIQLVFIAVIAILIKVFLQVFLGTILNVPRKPIQALELFNGEKADISYYIYPLFVYEFFFHFFSFYIWIYLLLFFIVSKFGNNLLIQLGYCLVIYFLYINFLTTDKIELFFSIILLIIGLVNWWMFKKWIRFE